MEETRKQIGDKIYYASDQYDALKGADALAMMTEWPEFYLPDFKKMTELMKGKVIFDGKNIYDPVEIKKTANPGKEHIATFSVLKKLKGVKVGTGGVVCLYDKLVPINDKNVIIPVTWL